MKEAEFRQLGLDWASFVERARKNADAVLNSIKPKYIRGENDVIEFAILESKNPRTATVVLAPQFLKQFESIFGPELLLAIPNRYTVIIFPKLAGPHQDFAVRVVDAYENSAYPVSKEVFELSDNGIRTVGIYEFL